MNILKRKEGKNLEKTLIFGEDGSFKSSFAEKYCKKLGLNPIVFDFDRTNFTNLDIIDEFDLSNDRRSNKSINDAINMVSKLDYDTWIFDGITTVIESFIGQGAGMSAYSSRSKMFYKLIHTLQNSGKNIIFIGQIDADLDFYKENESPSKVIIRLNSIVNRKFRCEKNGSNFVVTCVKDREGKIDGKTFTY